MEQELITLGILFFFGLVGGILAARFKQPILLGLLLVGAVVGPHALGLIHNEKVMESMIDFGAILMLFVIGLEFDLSKLKKIGLKAITVAGLKSGIAILIGFITGIILGLGVVASLFIGIILAFSSTVVIVKVLEEKDLINRQEVPLLLAVLIIEDIIAVIVLTFLSGMQDETQGMIGTIQNLVISVCILIIAYLAFVKFIKPLLQWVLKGENSEEVITFTALAMCAGFSYLAYVLKLSPAAGAFLAGSIVASLPQAKKFEEAVAPYNLMISSFFFIAVGTLVNFTSIKINIMIILILVLIVVLTRIFSFGPIIYLFASFKGDKMFFSSMAMFSVGEFALLIAQESTKFSPGMDLISISAAIVFITAILMSIMMNFTGKGITPSADGIPYRLRKKMDKFAGYIKAVTEELDLDSKYSRGLKTNIFKVMLSLLVILLTIFGWRKLYLILQDAGKFAQLYMIYLFTIALLAIMIFYTIYIMQKVTKSLSDIFANATNIRNMVQTRYIVKTAFLGCSLFLLTLIWPFVMFLFNMQVYMISVCAITFVLSIWQFHRISVSLDDNVEISRLSIPSYKKWDAKDTKSATKAINQGWKL